MNDYERIARIIRHLDEHHVEQPDLAALARIAGLSPFHFHRLFTRWAGVTPKDFLQSLTLAQVKERLRQGESVLEVALGAGLSGPGRLHDLCVNLDAATPGEIKSGGAGWTLVSGFTETPFGTCLVAESPRGICSLSFVESKSQCSAWATLQSDWPAAKIKRNDAVAARVARQMFNRSAKDGSRPSLRAYVRGTNFQVRVWRALLQVPPGRLVSYSQLAAAAGHPTASRAVGAAVGRNSLAYLIPCHRVIRETGVIGGYRWNPVRKRAMVAWECAFEPSSS